MSDLTLPEVRRCLQRIVVAAMEGKDDVVTAEARLALHLLTEWSERDLEAAALAWRICAMDKGKATPYRLLQNLDPLRSRRRAD